MEWRHFQICYSVSALLSLLDNRWVWKKVGIWLVVTTQSSVKMEQHIVYVNTASRLLTQEWCSNCIKINGELTTLQIWAKRSQISSYKVAMLSLSSINCKVNNISTCESSSYCKQQQTPAIKVSKKDKCGSIFPLASDHALGVLFWACFRWHSHLHEADHSST